MNPAQSTTASATSADAVGSPCVGVCTLGPGDICIGCLRTSAEIGAWPDLTSQQRSVIMAQLPQRLEFLFAK